MVKNKGSGVDRDAEIVSAGVGALDMAVASLSIRRSLLAR